MFILQNFSPNNYLESLNDDEYEPIKSIYTYEDITFWRELPENSAIRFCYRDYNNNDDDSFDNNDNGVDCYECYHFSHSVGNETIYLIDLNNDLRMFTIYDIIDERSFNYPI